MRSIKQDRAAARSAGLPYTVRYYREKEDNPYVYEKGMSLEDYELTHKLKEDNNYDYDRV